MRKSTENKYIEDILTATKKNQPSKLESPVSKILYAKATEILNNMKQEIIRKY
mgnify:CR=1 FL=1